MRYHYEKPTLYASMYGITYVCNRPVYDNCTLYLIEDHGLAVIQQRFGPESKITYWTEIDLWLRRTCRPGYGRFISYCYNQANHVGR